MSKKIRRYLFNSSIVDHEFLLDESRIVELEYTFSENFHDLGAIYSWMHRSTRSVRQDKLYGECLAVNIAWTNGYVGHEPVISQGLGRH